jgi:pyruvate formate lyase activating enzyme
MLGVSTCINSSTLAHQHDKGSPLQGIVFNLQRYSLHDGPGIRTLVFLKGCPMRCTWCCNPESQRLPPEVEFFAAKCQRCGRCLLACPRQAINPDLEATARVDHSRCDGCGVCAEACPTQALRVAGRVMSVEDVMSEARKDAAYYRRSQGGLTLSGGEPLAQPEFATAILRAAYNANLNTAIETTGYGRWEDIEAMLPWTELVLFDLKHADSATHLRMTGVPNEPILANARRLAARGHPMVLRVPLIPGQNMDDNNLQAIAQLALELCPQEVNLMPFHQLGKDKYMRLGRTYSLSSLPDLRLNRQELLQRARDIFEANGLRVHIGG